MVAALILAATAADSRCGSIRTDDLIACTEADRRRADAALDRAYRTALRRTEADDAALAPARTTNGGLTYSAALRAAQRAWLAFRAAECRVRTYASYDGHELPIYERACLADLTRQRTRQLQTLVAPR